MSTYAQLLIPPERFKASAAQAANDAAGDARSGVRTVRRPTRGIVLKEDTFATIRLVAGSGANRKVIDAGSRRKENGQYMTVPGTNKRATDVYSNFLLQGVNEERAEKFQILETFGEPYIFLFGQRARIMTFQGVLANTWDFNWEAEWWENYDNYLRGTKCVENDAMIFLSFDNTVVGGYILQTSSTKDAPNRNYVNFQFQLFVTTYTNYSAIGDPTALPVSERDLNGATTPLDSSRTVTGAELAQYRPNLIDPTQAQDRIFYDPNTGKVGTSLADALQAAVPSQVAKAWKSVTDITASVLQTASGIISGTVLRVPSGFAGTMAYDDADMTNVVQMVETGGVIHYTTFADNDDEYVGSTDQYGSSNFRSPLNNGFYRSIYNTEDEPLSELAERIWQAAGYDPDSSWEQTMADIVSGAKLGLTVIPAAISLTKAAGGVVGVADLSSQTAIPRQTLSAPPR